MKLKEIRVKIGDSWQEVESINFNTEKVHITLGTTVKGYPFEMIQDIKIIYKENNGEEI